MTNTIAIWLGLILIVVFGIDGFVYDWSFTVIFMKKFLELITFLAFWR